MARFLVSLAYRGKEYAELIVASDAQNAIEYGADKCIEIAARDNSSSVNKVIYDIDKELELYKGVYHPFSAEIIN